jgi:hypothetical protein
LAYLSAGGNFVGTEYDFLNYWHCVQILAANGDDRRDVVWGTAVAQLQTYLNHMQSQELKQSFCHNIPWHQTLLDLRIAKISDG